MPGASIGETFRLIIAHQFEALRDGDQFYYETASIRLKWRWSRPPRCLDIIERDTRY